MKTELEIRAMCEDFPDTYVSIRQHTSHPTAYTSNSEDRVRDVCQVGLSPHSSGSVRIRQDPSAYVSNSEDREKRQVMCHIRQQTSTYVRIRLIRQNTEMKGMCEYLPLTCHKLEAHTSAYVRTYKRIVDHTAAELQAHYL